MEILRAVHTGADGGRDKGGVRQDGEHDRPERSFGGKRGAHLPSELGPDDPLTLSASNSGTGPSSPSPSKSSVPAKGLDGHVGLFEDVFDCWS